MTGLEIVALLLSLAFLAAGTWERRTAARYRDAADRALAKAEEFHQVAKGYRDEGTNAHQRAYEHRVQCIRILDQAHQITKGDQQ